MIWKGEKRRPDGTEHNTNSIGAIHSLNGKPKDGENRTRDDRNVGAPEAPRGAGKDRKRSMVNDADGAV